MLVLLLTACDDDPGAAMARIDAFLADHPRGTAIVQARVGRESVEAVVGTTWHGEDLAARLAPCGDVPGFTAVLELEAGVFPATFHFDPALPDCVEQRLTTFPFEGPSRRGDTDLVKVRWRPEESVPPAAHTATDGLAGLAELPPPYFRRAPDGDALEYGDDLRVEDGRLRIRPTGDAAIVSGPFPDAEAWARHLTCKADTLTLVRVTLAFEDGYLEKIRSYPDTACVDDAAREARPWLREQLVDGVRLADAGNVLVVLDVPVGAW